MKCSSGKKRLDFVRQIWYSAIMITVNIDNFDKMKIGGLNCLVLPDGRNIDCTGAEHETKAEQAGYSLSQVLKAGICRTHWHSTAETFAVESGKELTENQKTRIRSMLHGIDCHILITDIAGVSSVKDSFGRGIKGV